MPTLLETKIKAARQSSAWQLVLDKFPFSVRNGLPRLPDRKIDVLEPLTRKGRLERQWGAAIERRHTFQQILQKRHGERLRIVPLVNASRLLLHLGRASVLENVGLYCERITGLPIIPGSTVKGVISTWACWEENRNRIYLPNAEGEIKFNKSRAQFESVARRILGDNSESGSDGAGEIIFFGACPTVAPRIGLDIVAPHHNSAGDDQDPKPNPFLCIEPGTSWTFALLANPRDGSHGATLLETASRWLRSALEQYGLGAKTAAGYGRFIDPMIWSSALQGASSQEAREKQAADQRALETMRAGFTGDYTELLFQNSVLALLNQPGKGDLLKREIEKIRSNPQNESWIPKITDALRGKAMKDHRKRLKEKDWFPADWLPQ